MCLLLQFFWKKMNFLKTCSAPNLLNDVLLIYPYMSHYFSYKVVGRSFRFILKSLLGVISSFILTNLTPYFALIL